MTQAVEQSPPQEGAWLPRLERRAQSLGVAVRGAFHPADGLGTVVLLGFTGSAQWSSFASAPERSDALPHPLDRWSRRIIGTLAREFDARDIYPSDGPTLPFQQFAMCCEPVHPSPIGLLIHTLWGLWHAYRGGLVFSRRLPLPVLAPSLSPCHSCALKPCLSGCPVDAFGSGHYDLEACVRHVSGIEGRDCRERGCQARRACPVAPQMAYVPEQARFHMSAFLAAMRVRDD